MNKSVLFHICCAPCSYIPIDLLSKERYRVKGFFYNPNIHPIKEFERRMENVKKMEVEKELDILYINQNEQARWESFEGESNERCEMCYRDRLEKTAVEAKNGGYDYFTTSLLISPYQNHEKIIEIAKECEKKHKVLFLYKDFRKIFRESYRLARENGIYTQKYCGCIVSLNESPFKEKIIKELYD